MAQETQRQEGMLQAPEEQNTQATEQGTEQKKPNQEVFLASIKAKHPDFDDEAAYQYAMDNYKAKKDRNDEFEKISGKLMDVLEGDDLALDFMDAAATMGFEVALTTLPEDVLQKALQRKQEGFELSDEDKQTKLNEYREKRKNKDVLKKKLKDNEEKTIKALGDFAKENNLSEQDLDEMVSPILQKLSEGDIDADFLAMIKNNKSLDKIKQDEYNRGLRDGKNQKIEEKEMKKQKGSNLPQTNDSQAELSSATERRPSPLSDLIRRR